MIDGEAQERILATGVADDPEVAVRIRRLVEETNAAVRAEQERAEREQAEHLRRKAAEETSREEARRRVREQAIREAEEAAEQARQGSARGKMATSADEEGPPVSDTIATGQAARASAVATPQACSRTETEIQRKTGPGMSMTIGYVARQTWFRRVWGGRRRRETVKRVSDMEGYRA